MQDKKNWTQNLENYRGLFFMLGLALSLAAVTEIFQWTTEYKTPTLDGETKKVAESTFTIPVIPREKPELPEPDPIEEPEPEPIKKPTDKFKQVDDLTKTRPQLQLSNLDTMGISSMTPPEVPTPVLAVMVENMARPKDCEDLRGKDEQMDCFNRWIQTYLAENVVFPERPRQFGESERIYVEFVINEFGRVEQTKIIRGNNIDFREEALRVIGEIPELVPASQLGQNVPVRVQIPVNFKLR